jgi:hypothetical protein
VLVYGFTTRVTVVVCDTEPLVAVTVNGTAVELFGVLLLEQPVMPATIAAEPAIKSTNINERRMFARRRRRRHSGNSIAAKKATEPYAICVRFAADAMVEEAVSVSVTVCAPDVAESEAGENVPVTPLGRPETAKLTVPG